MSQSSAQILSAIAPEISGDPSAFLDVAEMQIAPGLCGDKRPMLVAYLAAHIATVAQRQGASGPVSSMKEGQLALTFGGTSTSSLHATSYGAEYDRLSRACVWSAGTRGSYGAQE